MRSIYALLLRLHPKTFRDRFEAEMLCTFEDATQTEGTARLVMDGFVSFLRQRILRSCAEQSALRVPENAPRMFVSLTLPGRSSHLQISRLILGGVISLGLFVVSGTLIGRGGAHLKVLHPNNSGEADLAQTLTPSDLMSVSDECAPGAEIGCRSYPREHPGAASTHAERSLPIAGAQTKPYELPFPSGRFGIGQVLYRFTDTLSEMLPDSADGSRELKVFIWYPASIDPDTSVATQNVWDFSKATGEFVQTHTVQNATIADGISRFPLVLFRPAVGNSSAAYLSQIENLVSHGYIVASVEPREEFAAQAFGDTRLTLFEGDLRRSFFFPASRTPQAVLDRAEALAHNRESLASADLRFAFDQVILLGSETKRAAPFAGRIDLEHVGAFGHASGGNAVARLCQLDSRISACLDENGWTPSGPIPQAGRWGLLRQPFMWIDMRLKAPDGAELTYARVSRNNFTRLTNDSETAADLELRSLTGGGYRVSLLMPDLNDKNFTDGPLVWSMSPSHRGDSEARAALAVTNVYARTFFDAYLKAKSSQLLESEAEPPFPRIRVRHYPATKR